MNDCDRFDDPEMPRYEPTFGKKNVYIYIYLSTESCWFALALRENGWLQNWWSLTMANTKQTKWPKVCVVLSFVLSIFLNAPRTKQHEYINCVNAT